MIKAGFHFLLGMFFLFQALYSQAQILNSNDPVPVYNSALPPSQPAYGQIGKWVITPTITGWSTSAYKPYFYNGMAFRLLYPKSYAQGVNDGKTYPVIIFLHGLGEAGTIYNNDFQLYHGGLPTLNAETSGVLDAYCLFPQNTAGVWGPTYYQNLIDIVNYMVINNKVDPQRIIVYGLSAGGTGTWAFLTSYNKFLAAGVPMSAADYNYQLTVNNYKFTPVWLSQGGKDTNPAPSTAQNLVNVINAAGGNLIYSYFPNDGHDTWDDMWANPNLFPWMMAQNKANPWVLFGRNQFCTGDPINVTLGLSAGFDGYQWMKDGVLISGANSNTYNATALGSYSARYLNGTTWSSWSPSPMVISIKAPTITPAIQLAKNESNLIPALDTSKGVYLTVPGNFIHYNWVQAGTTTVIDTNQVFLAKTPGQYQVTVAEKYGCSGTYSPVYTVVSANGTGAPNPVNTFSSSPASSSSLNLSWTYTNSSTNPVSGFEIYRGTTAGGPYTFVNLASASSLSYVDAGLSASQTYYYLIRAVNGNGASSPSKEIKASTFIDTQAPTAPTNLKLYPGSNQVNLTWTASTDNVGVAGYNIYVNGVLSYKSMSPSISIYDLKEGASYSFVVKAFDAAGNLSASSTTLSGNMYDNGFNYKYYTYTGTWTSLQDLNALNPVAYGNTPNLDISKATQATNFAFLWNGTLHIPVAGNYTFLISSSDGSQVFIDQPYTFTGTPTIQNDGLHSSPTTGTVTLNLTKGEHSIAIAYYNGTNPHSISLSWKNTANGVGSTPQVIPNFIFSLQNPDQTTTAPTAPTNLKGLDNSNGVNLTWTNNGTNVTGYNVYRAPSGSTSFTLLNSSPLISSINTYSDNTAMGNTTYSYKVNAVNPFGSSAYTNTLSISTGNKTPIINPIVSPTYMVGTFNTLNLTAFPRSGTTLTLSLTGISADLSFKDNGGGQGVLTVSPNSADIGIHNFTLKAVDVFGGTTSLNFTVNIQASVNPLITNPPTFLKAHGETINSITLNWVVDPNASSYYIYRSTSATGNFSLMDSVSGNVNTYLNTGLNSNTSYFYQLKSKNSSGLSLPGNIAYGTTLQYVVELNFNSDQPAPFPWNNTNGLPSTGLKVANMGTTAGTNSGINMIIARNFAGSNTLGAVTGNNSGIYPDNVIRGQYYTQTPDSAVLQISGLSNSTSYDFVFFTSWANPFAGAVTTYTINGITVNLDPTNNSSKTVQINNVLADPNGNIFIIIKAYPGQTYGIINSLVIQAHQIPTNSPNVTVSTGKNSFTAVYSPKIMGSGAEIIAYPVPLSNILHLSINSPVNGNYKVSILNLQGKLIYTEPFQILGKGMNTRTFQEEISPLEPGLYLLEIESDVLPTKSILITKP